MSSKNGNKRRGTQARVADPGADFAAEQVQSAPAAFEKAVYSKVTWRLIPYLFVCYILAYVDRVNVGFAKLQMQHDLGMSDTVYGIGAGIFFVGYFLFEVPANVMLQKLGARRWLGPIMIAWGIVSACTIFARGAASFYALRFLLGVVECGFFPGVIYYLTYWFTRKQRARIMATFISANPLSGVFASPVSGAILAHMTGVSGLRAWQWLFLVEGIPSALAGIVTLMYLADGPSKASWLKDSETNLLLNRLHEEEVAKKAEGHSYHSLADAFRSGRVWWLCAVFFGFQMGNYGLWFWLPQILQDTLTKDPWLIGLLSAIPWGASALSMILWAHHSDVTGERRWHVALGAGAAALAFGLSGLAGISGITALTLVTLAAVGIMCGQTVFWTLPINILSGAAAAAGIAWINSVGNLAGYLSPFLIGHIRDTTGSMAIAQFVLAASMFGASSLTLLITRGRKRFRNQPAVA
jgi:sugar phosphate permease